MRQRFRFLHMIIWALCRRHDLNIEDESILRFIVMPWDCVVKLAGNDRYHSFMDVGRIDLVLRMGWGRGIVKYKWNPFVLTAHIRYRYPLKVFQKFKLRTKLIYWDKQYFWMEHIFECKGRILATAISKNGATNKNGIVSTESVFQSLDQNMTCPPCPDRIILLREAENILKAVKIAR